MNGDGTTTNACDERDVRHSRTPQQGTEGGGGGGEGVTIN